jgi:hypothetical protein
MATIPFPITPILDSGVRANENPIVGWTKPIFTVGSGSLQIVSNTIRAVAVPASNYLSRQPFGPNQEAYVTINTEDAASYCEVVLCLTGLGVDATTNGYILSCNSATNQLLINRVINGAFAQVGAVVAQVISNGDSFGLRRLGNTLEIWYRVGSGLWTLIATRTDSTHVTGGRIGMIVMSLSQQLKDFGGGGISVEHESHGWTVTRGSVDATLNDQPTYTEYTFDDKTVRKDWK